jgi:hypothetical protein
VSRERSQSRASLNAGFDVCEPWEGFPASPKKEDWAKAPGADRPMPDCYQKLLYHWKQPLPHMTGAFILMSNGMCPERAA